MFGFLIIFAAKSAKHIVTWSVQIVYPCPIWVYLLDYTNLKNLFEFIEVKIQPCHFGFTNFNRNCSQPWIRYLLDSINSSHGSFQPVWLAKMFYLFLERNSYVSKFYWYKTTIKTAKILIVMGFWLFCKPRLIEWLCQIIFFHDWFSNLLSLMTLFAERIFYGGLKNNFGFFR